MSYYGGLIFNSLCLQTVLLKRKTAELAAACEKHYSLEQELAFFKIDAKFDSLGRPPQPHADTDESVGSVVGESPYVGQGRFTEKMRERERVKRRLDQEFQAMYVRLQVSSD